MKAKTMRSILAMTCAKLQATALSAVLHAPQALGRLQKRDFKGKLASRVGIPYGTDMRPFSLSGVASQPGKRYIAL